MGLVASLGTSVVEIAGEHTSLCNKEHTKAAENLRWGSCLGHLEKMLMDGCRKLVKHYLFDVEK